MLDSHSPTFFHQRAKLREQRRGIVRTRRGFGVILHAKDRLGFVAQTFNRLVVQIGFVNRHVGGQ